ncbi:hypothetical protein LTR56_005743 [Elasticomyces elasticus]|nr:hypothetical protein LTR56_005743 [Elasticomyces elasticus]KAK3657460.1 hypothetical protein LTR22_009326 [Elasticomyces elasticus]KAK4925673.1 hypothetical protein LTR49_007283 [Elasticomyces elasticus]KAK5765005.1 hypothetical protein LTS12_004783 [Elasticomyces elasticus]
MGEIEGTSGDSGVIHAHSARALPLQTVTHDPPVTTDVLLENIVGFLETTDLFNASCVSKTWRATVHKCWSRFPEQFGSVAGPAVMGTVELLEQILQHAEITDLMIWRQVSVLWRNVITTTSPSLQRALFLLASPGPAKLLEWVPNPLATLPGEYAVIPAITDDASSTRSSRTALIVRLHRWLSLDKGYLHEKRQLTFFFEPQMLLTHTTGIWQDMHVTQPPATEVALHYSIERSIDNDYTEVHGVARNSQGVTIGDILNRINITVEKLRKKSEFKLPKVTDHTERLGDVEALDSRLRTRFIEKLDFSMMVGTARDCVCCESLWIVDGYNRLAEVAAAAALVDADFEKPTEEEAEEAMDRNMDQGSEEYSW